MDELRGLDRANARNVAISSPAYGRLRLRLAREVEDVVRAEGPGLPPRAGALALPAPEGEAAAVEVEADAGLRRAGEAASPSTPEAAPGFLGTVEALLGAETCMICLDEMTVGTRALRTPCLHLYHPRCLTRWQAECEGQVRCPVCSSDLWGLWQASRDA